MLGDLHSRVHWLQTDLLGLAPHLGEALADFGSEVVFFAEDAVVLDAEELLAGVSVLLPGLVLGDAPALAAAASDSDVVERQQPIELFEVH